jgi:hypothetical protein
VRRLGIYLVLEEPSLRLRLDPLSRRKGVDDAVLAVVSGLYGDLT